MKTPLAELKAHMSALQARAKEAQDEARDKYKEQMPGRRTQSAHASTELAEIKAAGDGKWETLVAEMEEIRDAFTRLFHYFRAQF